MARQAGHADKAYYKVGGDGASGSYSEIELMGDATVKGELETEDDTTRDNDGFTMTEVIGHNLSADFVVTRDPANTSFAALRAAFEGNTLMGFKFLDGAEGSGKGVGFDGMITRFEERAPVKGLVKVDITVMPANGGAAPAFISGS